MTTSLLILAVAGSAGVALQRAGYGDRARKALWRFFFWGIAPILVFSTFVHLHISHALEHALLAAIIATWTIGLVGVVYAKLVASEREERGALILAIGWGNTGFLGYSFAQLLFGTRGLALAVVYDRLAWLVPASGVSVAVARRFGGLTAAPRSRRARLAVAANPPLFAMLAALIVRSITGPFTTLSPLVSTITPLVAPIGFTLIGLSVPLERVSFSAADLRRAGGALLIRFVGAPVALLAAGGLLGADVPRVFFLLSAMPPAFNVLVLARVYQVRPKLAGLLVVGSTCLVLPLTVIGFTALR